MITISVVIPCYNVAAYVAECLDSVISQTSPAHEIICVDDGSTDRTKEILREYSIRYPFLIRVLDGPNQGASAARNKGLETVTGDYVQFLDADDVLTPDKFQRQLTGFSPATDVVVSDWILKDATLSSEIRRTTLEQIRTAPLDTAIMTVISTCNPIYRTASVKMINGYDEGLASAQDWEFHLRLLLSGAKFNYVPGFFFIARKVKGSVSSDWIKVSIQASEIIIKLEQALKGAGIGKPARQYVAGLFLDSAVFSPRPDAARKYAGYMMKWSDNDYSFVSSKLKRMIIRIFGVDTLLKLERMRKLVKA